MSKEAYAASFEPPRPPDDGLDAIDRARIKSEHKRRAQYERDKIKLAQLHPNWNFQREGEPS